MSDRHARTETIAQRAPEIQQTLGSERRRARHAIRVPRALFAVAFSPRHKSPRQFKSAGKGKVRRRQTQRHAARTVLWRRNAYARPALQNVHMADISAWASSLAKIAREGYEQRSNR